MGGYNIVAGFLIFFFLFIYFAWFGTSLKIENDYPFGFAPMGMCNLTWPNADNILANVISNHPHIYRYIGYVIS